MMTRWRPLLLVLFLLATPVSADELTPEQLQFFEAKIRPVLVKECYGCHSNKAGNVRGGLRLDTKERMLSGGSSGLAIVPGDLEESWLYNSINHIVFVMPPKRKLSQSVINDFKTWIEMGAPDPRVNKVAEIQSSISPDDIAKAREAFWAYKKPIKHEPPKVDDANWPKTEIDRFILAKLEQSDLKPAGDAEPTKVLRRLCFDLIGLPPTPKQVEYFETQWKADPDRAIAFVVNRLLEKKQFGERWGRHWLDVVRYAESTGSMVNVTFPNAWRYRDYVIDSFNEDKPFDRFVQEQIAGDLLPIKSDEEWTRNLIATSFLAIGPKNVNEQNRRQFAADLVDEQIDATTRVFLGMSVACARCHDHKFDAIPQTDYYALAGVFGNMTTYFGTPQSDLGNFSPVQQRQNSTLLILPVADPNPYDKGYTASELESLRGQMTEKLQERNEQRRNRSRGGDAKNAQRNRIRLANELALLSTKLGIVDEKGKPQSYCMGVQEGSRPVDSRLLVRGEIDQPGSIVPRGFPQVLCSTPVEIASSKSGRLDLARWIGSDQNSLTARVMVNRIWLHLMGRGIVASTENFGVTGQTPSHPELLDNLAKSFVDSGWSVKKLVRDIATSRIYRTQSTFNKKYHEYDPDNRLLWRANPRRLDAEALRDAMLSISGEIDLDRPRGSEVAKAGFTRVRDGVLGNPRDIQRKAFDAARNGSRGAMRSRFGGRPGFGGPGGRRFPGGVAGRQGQSGTMEAAIREAVRKATSQLDMEGSKIRSVYMPIVRDEEPRALEVFDGADSSAITGQRESSNTANQALYMMNNRFVIQQSDSFAGRIAGMGLKPEQQIQQAFVLAYGRLPTSAERAAAVSFVKSFSSSGDSPISKATLSAFCQSLFASAEFRFID